MTRDLFAFKCLPQTDDLDDALCLVAGQLQMVLQGVCRAVPVAGQSSVQNFQMLLTGLRSTHSSVQSLDFEDCRLNEIEWAPLMSNGAFPDPIHTLKECSLKYNTFTEMNFNRFDFSDGNEIVGSMFAKCEMQLANFKGVELHETEFYQCDLRKADFRDATGYKVDILGSRLKDAKFSLPEAVNLLADLKIKLS